MKKTACLFVCFSFLFAAYAQSADVAVVEPNISVVELKGHEGEVETALFSRDGQKIVTIGSTDKTIRVWDVESGKELQKWNIADDNPTLPADVRAVLASAALQKLESNEKMPESIESQIPEFVTEHAASPDKRKIVTYTGLALWSYPPIEPGRGLAKRIEIRQRRIEEAEIDFRMRTAEIWDAQSGRLLRTLRGHTDYVLDAAFSSDSKMIVTGSQDGTARIWNTNTGRTLRVLDHEGPVRLAFFSSDNKRVITQDEFMIGFFLIWDVRTGKKLLSTYAEGGVADISPDGKKVAMISRGYRFVRIVTLP